MFKLKKIGVLSLGYAAAIFSFIASIVQTLLLLLQLNIPLLSQQIDPTVLALLTGKAMILMVILIPLIGLILGFLAGVIMAAIYNYIVVKLTGGLKIELEK